MCGEQCSLALSVAVSAFEQRLKIQGRQNMKNETHTATSTKQIHFTRRSPHYVESLATRIASFDKRAISETKRFADVASLPPDFEIAPEWDVCLASIMRPAAQERIKKLMEQGFHRLGDVEDRLGYHVGQLGR
jgi:hypothetical protein